MTRVVPVQRRARVLVADDSSSIRSVLSRRLGKLFHLTVARDGVEALEMARSATASFDLVLTDISMPRMSGLELFAAFRDAAPELAARTVFMSGTFDDDEVCRTVAAHGVLLIKKPFELEALTEQLIVFLEAVGLSGALPLASTG